MSGVELSADRIDSMDVMNANLGHRLIQTAVPLTQNGQFSSYNESARVSKSKPLPLLPSHKFCHTIWHELRSTEVKGNQLKAPRVREGPEFKREQFRSLPDDEGEDKIHHQLSGQELQDYTRAQENWELAKRVNLSFQKLDHAYQHKTFHNILRRMRSVEMLIVRDNSLCDLSDLTLPCCKKADFSTNYFSSFNSLPRMSEIETLILCDNQIKCVKGLSRFPKLKVLSIRGNGLYFDKFYRNRVFDILPKLVVLDDILQLPADRVKIDDNISSRCVTM